MVDAKAIRKASYAGLLLLRSIYDRVKCLENEHFTFFIWTRLSVIFSNSIDSFFFFKMSMNIIPSQNTEAITFPSTVAFFVTWDGFHCLCWLPIWSKILVIDPCFIHFNISHERIVLLRSNSSKQLWVLNCRTHFEQSFLIDKCSYKIVNALPLPLWYSLPYATSIYDF